jgi:hypothetical protein
MRERCYAVVQMLAWADIGKVAMMYSFGYQCMGEETTNVGTEGQS